MRIKDINPNLIPCLSRFFSSRVITDLADNGHSLLASSLLSECSIQDQLNPKMLLKDFFDMIFDILFWQYRNEYMYKNAIANKILLGIHSLNSSFMLTEFRALNCKADTVILNGTSNVYEIKSEYDSLERLERQINAYKQVFDCVNVITTKNQIEKVEQVVEESVGLMVLNDCQSIRTLRKPTSLKHQVSPSAIFDSLRKNEYAKIIKEHFGAIPEVPNTHYYRECKQLFEILTPEAAHDAMVKVLKQRGACQQLNTFIKKVPKSLKAASLACKLNHKQKESFLNLLEQNIRQCVFLR